MVEGSRVMDFRVKDLAKARSFPTARDGLRVVAKKAPQAGELATSWLDSVRPLAVRIYALRRRIATITITMLAGLLFVHVMFGANGMLVYKQKRLEYQSLQRRIAEEQNENDRYTRQIDGLKTDEKAIEKEAREQLHYARPGEYVYVPPAAAEPLPGNHSAKK
jgi:cell division protein FtsB